MEKLDNIERCLNIFAAIASSTAIAGWALWQHASFMWACIIALSQVYSAAKPHLPFGLRLRSLHNLAPDIEALTLSAERDWFRVSRGELTEDEIIDRATVIKEKKVQATQKHLKGVVLPEQDKLTKLADTKATAYMENFMEE